MRASTGRCRHPFFASLPHDLSRSPRRYRKNPNYKTCEQDGNRVGLLDCEINLADVKRLRVRECPRGDDDPALTKFRDDLLRDALEQVDSAEKVRRRMCLSVCVCVWFCVWFCVRVCDIHVVSVYT